ncbi:MAG: AraC family transcriptional regulator [Algoriphagus sp.]|nr:AraC family transcriptional regulator [Algoriphagus sp.]
MPSSTLLIKNMVCPRCIEAVKDSLIDLNIGFSGIELGKVTLTQEVSDVLKSRLSTALEGKGFEILESKTSAMISQTKSLIIEQIHHSDESLSENFSSFLAEKLDHEYTSLSRLFSQVEGITIEKYITRQKIERVKEFLFYDQLSLSEIAFKLGYSSVAYLSSQFKKETGMTPSEFKKNHSGERKSLDQV